MTAGWCAPGEHRCRFPFKTKVKPCTCCAKAVQKGLLLHMKVVLRKGSSLVNRAMGVLVQGRSSTELKGLFCLQNSFFFSLSRSENAAASSLFFLFPLKYIFQS